MNEQRPFSDFTLMRTFIGESNQAVVTQDIPSITTKKDVGYAEPFNQTEILPPNVMDMLRNRTL